MNFNLDDPLADLLSDNSNDNDSFFDNPAGKKKIKPKLPTPARKSEAKGKLEDLFGIKEESEPQFKIPPMRASTNLMTNKTDDKPIATSTPKIKTKIANNSDILSDFGFDPKNPKVNIVSKDSLFDDILSSIHSKKPSSSGKIEDQNVKKDDGVNFTRGTISRQSTDTTETSANLIPATRPKTSTGRRSSTASPAKVNTLDLFSKDNDNALRVPTPKPKKIGSTADWLGLGHESVEEVANVQTVKSPETIPKAEILKTNEVSIEPLSTLPALESDAPTSIPVQISVPNALLTSNIGTQNLSQIIYQQATQLDLATQMKSQEAALMEMQRKQLDLLTRQEEKFNELVKKQLCRQSQLEQNIKAQQERINAHIQILMSQPINNEFLPKPNLEENQKNIAKLQEASDEFIELRAEMKRLELEKLRLEDLVSTINSNHEKEIEINDKSFKKQTEALEDHLASVESRLKNENIAQQEFYTKKLKIADKERIEIQSRLEGTLAELRKSHDEEIKRLKATHEEDIEGLKDDYRKMINTIRQSKLLEFAAVQENNSYLETLRIASNHLESVTDGFQSLRMELERKMDAVHHEKEINLSAREKKIEDSERRIQMLESSNEEEKARLIELVTTLENQLRQLSKDSSEENWIMRQKTAALDAEKAAFEKEKALFREQMARDEKRIEELKESQLQEKQRLIAEINEERTQLGVEKTEIETLKKLQVKPNIDQYRLQVEASLKVAQDVTRHAEIERERLVVLQRQLETQKRSLVDREEMLRCKEEELEKNIIQARASERRANEATQKAQSSEQNFMEKFTFLQHKIREISEKESRLSRERLKLSQNHIEIQNYRSKLEQNRCSLCQIGERNGELSHVLKQTHRSVDVVPMIDDPNYFGDSTVKDIDRFLDEDVLNSLERMRSSSSFNVANEQVRVILEESKPPESNDEPSTIDLYFG